MIMVFNCSIQDLITGILVLLSEYAKYLGKTMKLYIAKTDI